MALVGSTVTYTAHPELCVGDDGSVFHPHVRSFAGIVTRTHDDGVCDLTIFPPGRAPAAVEAVTEGAEAGQFTVRAVDAVPEEGTH